MIVYTTWQEAISNSDSRIAVTAPEHSYIRLTYLGNGVYEIEDAVKRIQIDSHQVDPYLYGWYQDEELFWIDAADDVYGQSLVS